MTFDYTDCENLTPSPSNTSLQFTPIPGSKFNYRLKASNAHASFSPPAYAFVNNSNDETVPVDQRQQCFVQFDVPYDIDPAVLLYYKLTKFYQNHRRYVKSIDADQLRGDAVSFGTIHGGNCKPLDTTGSLIYYPCGLIANSLFNGSWPSLCTSCLIVLIPPCRRHLFQSHVNNRFAADIQFYGHWNSLAGRAEEVRCAA